ncbi:C39 family peptidase [Alteromonas sp. ASW11-36]|uniref:C39 family peptidase n=1 Tax=Alteromonas arenosi TaxID=3055817 RepID=A0ABT7STB1_9ALTE|nr:C39 family peptidase [Alteromonas sp. ASW11-36]MDM7859435.1 C39 family peptidase [Alteromonas sp. ASW11-36]
MRTIIAVVALCIGSIILGHGAAQAQFPQQVQQPQYVGIPSTQMNYFAAAQNNSQWCWAAAIQMVLNYYGVSISQEQIVARTYGVDPYGNLPNWAGSFQAITANLNNWNVDNLGNQYQVMASLNWGAPTPAVLLQELSQGRPVIVGYSTGPNTGHAVVITAASYTMSPSGPIIQSVVVRDPWPSAQNIQTSGRVEYPGAQLASVMQAYWYVRVQ